MAESEEELKSLLMRVKEKSEKAGLKLIQKAKIIASGPIISWRIDGEKVETVTDFIFLGSKITADGDCSHENKRRLLFGRKVKVLVAQSCLTLLQPQGLYVARQASLSMGFSRQEYWHGLPFPSPGIFPTQGLNLGLLHCRRILYHLSP